MDLSDAQAQELMEIAGLVDKIEQYQRENKIVSFRPIGNQDQFFSMNKPVRLVFGSNRSGKSVVGTVELIAHALGYRPWLPEDHPDRIVRLANGEPIPVPNVGFHLVENLKTAGTLVFLRKMEEWLPKGAAKIKKNNLGQPVRVEYACGSVQHVLSQEMGVSAIEGSSGHYASSDEPPRRDMWVALTRGLIDHSGNAWITATPIKASIYMAELMTEAMKPDSDSGLVSLNIDDNRVSRGGYLEDAAVDRFIKSLPAHEVAARVYGKPAHLAGAVYKMFRAGPPHVIEPFEIPPSWPRIMAIDPAGRKPVAVVWIAISPQNTWYVYRELYTDGLPTFRAVAKEIKHLEGWERLPNGMYISSPFQEPVLMRVIDTSGNAHERTSGMSATQQFGQEGIFLYPAQKQGYIDGINLICEKLSYDDDPESLSGEPGLMVFNTCSRCIHEFINFVWKPVNETRYGDDPSDKPLKTNDDILDGIRYLAMMGITFKSLRGLLDKFMRGDV